MTVVPEERKLFDQTASECFDFSHCEYLLCLQGSSWHCAQTPELIVFGCVPALACAGFFGPWQLSQPIPAAMLSLALSVVRRESYSPALHGVHWVSTKPRAWATSSNPPLDALWFHPVV